MNTSKILAPAFCHVSDAPQQRMLVWDLLQHLSHAEQPMFVRHAQCKPAGYNITVYDAATHTIYRAHARRGLMTALKSIRALNRNVSVLSSTQFVCQDRSTVGQSLSAGMWSDYTDYTAVDKNGSPLWNNAGLTD